MRVWLWFGLDWVVGFTMTLFMCLITWLRDPPPRQRWKKWWIPAGIFILLITWPGWLVKGVWDVFIKPSLPWRRKAQSPR